MKLFINIDNKEFHFQEQLQRDIKSIILFEYRKTLYLDYFASEIHSQNLRAQNLTNLNSLYWCCGLKQTLS